VSEFRNDSDTDYLKGSKSNISLKRSLRPIELAQDATKRFKLNLAFQVSVCWRPFRNETSFVWLKREEGESSGILGWMERKRGRERKREGEREREMVRDLIRITLWQSKGEPISPFYYSFCLLLSNFSSLLLFYVTLLNASFYRIFSCLFISHRFYLCHFCVTFAS